MNWSSNLTFAVWILGIPVGISSSWHNAHAEGSNVTATEVSLTELKEIAEKKSAVIIDVNSTESYDKGHVPGAIHFAANKDKFATVLPADKKSLIVAYCGGPMCTAWEDAAKAAKELGYTNIKHFKGGIKAWNEAGYPQEKKS